MRNKEVEKETIESLFEFDENESIMEKEKATFKKAKRKSIVKMMSVSLGMILLVIVLLCVMKMQVTPNLVGREIMEKESYHQIFGGNAYLSTWDKEYRLVGSRAVASKYKLLEGIPVYEGQVTLSSSVIEDVVNNGDSLDWEENQYVDTYGVNGNKAMQFFHPRVDYPAYANNFAMLRNMGPEKVAELGISFDKPYTLAEVEAMMPAGVTLVWNWVDIPSEYKTPEELKLVYLSSEISGFPMLDKVGIAIKKPVEEFKTTLEMGMRQGGTYKDDVSYIYENLGGEKIADDTIKINGVVVTGRATDLLKFEGQNFVKASSLGATVEKY